MRNSKNTKDIFNYFDIFFKNKLLLIKDNFYKGKFNDPSLVGNVGIEVNKDEESVILQHYFSGAFDSGDDGGFIGEDEENKKFYFEDYLLSQLKREAHLLYIGLKYKIDEFLNSKDGIDNYKSLVFNKVDSYLIKSEIEPYKKYGVIKEIIKTLKGYLETEFAPFVQDNNSFVGLKPIQRATLNITVGEFGYLIKILEESNVFEIKQGHAKKFFEALSNIFTNDKGGEISATSLYNKFTNLDIDRDTQYYNRMDKIIENMSKKNNFHKKK